MDELKTLRIESLAQGGDGLAREPGQPIVFVEGSAPGDLLRVRLAPSSAKAPDYRRGSIVEILEAGPSRRPPPCPEAGTCGGCQWQHLKDEQQDTVIRELLLSALRRVGRLDVADDVVTTTTGLPSRLAYRQRVRVHLAQQATLPVLGFRRANSHAVHPVSACPVAEPGLQSMMERLSARLPELAHALQPLAAELALDLPTDGAALAHLEVAASVTSPQLASALAMLVEICPEIVAAEAVGPPRRHGDPARARLGERNVPYRRGPLEDPQRFAAFASPGGFLQASRMGNALLISRVLQAAHDAALPRGSRVLELFAGDGNFSLPLAAAGFDVVASDSNERAVVNAALALEREVARLPGRLRIEHASADAHASRLARGGERVDLIVLDPPRSGARETCEILPRLRASAIIMVSCDAATLARDVAILSKAGYSLARAEPLALFPQTAHFETVALMTR